MRTVMISPVCRALAWIRPRRAVAWGAVVALTLALFVARAEAGSLFFAEPFNGPGEGPNLEDPDNAYVVSGGVIRKLSSSGGDDRSYVRTFRTDYRSSDWTYTISFDTSGTGQEIVFIGVGAGERNSEFFNEPGNAAFFRIHSTSVVSGRIDVAVWRTGQPGSDLLDTI
ncbi:MAG: hypothetical protein HYY46_25115 [Deltaproteobacteria bacterium]|nr:hypothetical protein [Deltaproteobacteria bacterium]